MASRELILLQSDIMSTNVQTMMGDSKADFENPNFFLFKIRKLHVASICEFNPPFRLEMIDKHEKVAATFHSAQ